MTIVIDAGHGGFDPGKVGINHVLEKDINLSVAYKVKKLLELENIRVVMTRKDENGLYKKSDGDKKRIDMNNRIKIINGSEAAFAISIHQNSFSQETSHGAQVFYYEGSRQGQELAVTLQETIKKSMMDGNHRLARPNSSYFLLRYSNCPLVIVECGFLTNRREAALLAEDSYQDKIAWAIYLGVMEYIKAYLKENNFADEPPAS
jgi:N-acetylmuramoyl-L-alanine amidase